MHRRVDVWMFRRLDDWKIGRIDDWRIRGVEDWMIGKSDKLKSCNFWFLSFNFEL